MRRSFSESVVRILAIVIVAMACEPESKSVRPDDTSFFPVQVGRYFIYSIAETQYTQSARVDTLYELKVEVTDSFPNVEGGHEYILKRSVKSAGELE